MNTDSAFGRTSARALAVTLTLLFASTLSGIAQSPFSSSRENVMITVATLALPAAHHLSAFDYATYGAIVAYHAGDYLSTEKFLKVGIKEGTLPYAFVASKPGLATYMVGLSALEIGASVYMHRHGHVRLARALDSLSVTTGAANVGRNLHFVADRQYVSTHSADSEFQHTGS